jgi:hypothetical protein
VYCFSQQSNYLKSHFNHFFFRSAGNRYQSVLLITYKKCHHENTFTMQDHIPANGNRFPLSDQSSKNTTADR